jgi:folylpolyglutamate synthase/dihydropteroate synthase
LKYLIESTEEFSRIHNIKYINIPPADNYFLANQMLAKSILKFLGFDLLIDGEKVKFKGREEQFNWGQLNFNFIGAHNPDGMRETVFKLNKNNEFYDVLLFSFSKRDVSDIVLMLKTITEFTPSKSALKMSYFEHPKAINLKILEDVQKMLCHNRNIELINDWKTYLNELREADSRQKILVLGSYYFIGEVQSYIFTHQ